MDHSQIYIVLAIVFGFLMAWGIGANDVANAIGTSVGSKALTLTQAIVIAALFEAAGALLAGGGVTDTIRNKIINGALLSHDPDTLILGMLACLLSAGSWLIIATHFSWPVSTTHSIIGAVIGFGTIELGTQAIYWDQVLNIVLSWIAAPILGGIVAYVLFRSVQFFIFNAKSPIDNAKRAVPFYIFIVASVVIFVTLSQGLPHIGFDCTAEHSLLITLLAAATIAVIGRCWLAYLPQFKQEDYRSNLAELAYIEKLFALLMLFTACAMAFAHGSNDVANAIGPLAAVIGMVQTGSTDLSQMSIPFWVMLLGATGIILGLMMYGYKIIATIGSNITQLTPSRGFAAQLATASTVIIASGLGMPISTTHTLVGAVLGVGFARGIGALNLTVIRSIFMSWIITLPIGAILAMAYYHLLALLLH